MRIEPARNWDCAHDKEWIAGPIGYVATHWECAGCGMRISAGEMHLLSTLWQIKREVKELSSRLPQNGESK